MKQREKRGKRKKYIYTSIYIYIYFYLLSKQTFNWLFIIYTYAYIYIYIHILYIHTHIYILYEVSYYILITCLRECCQVASFFEEIRANMSSNHTQVRSLIPRDSKSRSIESSRRIKAQDQKIRLINKQHRIVLPEIDRVMIVAIRNIRPSRKCKCINWFLIFLIDASIMRLK